MARSGMFADPGKESILMMSIRTARLEDRGGNVVHEYCAVIMSQACRVPHEGRGRDEAIRAELYRQFRAEEAN